MAYERTKVLIGGGSTKDLGALQRFVAGSTAGVVSQTMIYPMEVSVVWREVCGVQ